MTAVALELDVRSLDRTLRNLGAMEARLKDLRPAWRVVSELLEHQVSSTFESQGGRIGQLWRPLAASTVKARARGWGYYRQPSAGAGPTGPILVWTGTLKRSFRRGGRGHVRRVSRSSLTWGSSIRSGKYHQPRGFARMTSKLPRRPMLEFRDRFQLREVTLQPVRLHVIGAPAGAIRSAMGGRVRMGPLARMGSR